MRILLHLKEQYGDLNKALVLEYVRANGVLSETQIAQDVGLNRSVVRRALQDLSDSNT